MDMEKFNQMNIAQVSSPEATKKNNFFETSPRGLRQSFVQQAPGTNTKSVFQSPDKS